MAKLGIDRDRAEDDRVSERPRRRVRDEDGDGQATVRRTRHRDEAEDDRVSERPRRRVRDGDEDDEATLRPRHRDEEREASEERAARAASREGTLTAGQATKLGVREISELTGKRPEGVTGLQRVDGGWKVGIEVVEDRRVPSSTDILAIYEAEFDGDGELVSYRRVRRYSRGSGDDRDGSGTT